MTNFDQVLEELRVMHDKKQTDYGRTGDPFSNVRASEAFGIPGWIGALTRANDKMRRLQKFAAEGNLANESVEDSLIDLAVYAIIGLILYREEQSEERVQRLIDNLENHAEKLAEANTFGTALPENFRTYAEYLWRDGPPVMTINTQHFTKDLNKLMVSLWDGFDFSDD
jgi:hypothetical protein